MPTCPFDRGFPSDAICLTFPEHGGGTVEEAVAAEVACTPSLRPFRYLETSVPQTVEEMLTMRRTTSVPRSVNLEVEAVGCSDGVALVVFWNHEVTDLTGIFCFLVNVLHRSRCEAPPFPRTTMPDVWETLVAGGEPTPPPAEKQHSPGPRGNVVTGRFLSNTHDALKRQAAELACSRNDVLTAEVIKATNNSAVTVVVDARALLGLPPWVMGNFVFKYDVVGPFAPDHRDLVRQCREARKAQLKDASVFRDKMRDEVRENTGAVRPGDSRVVISNWSQLDKKMLRWGASSPSRIQPLRRHEADALMLNAAIIFDGPPTTDSVVTYLKSNI